MINYIIHMQKLNNIFIFRNGIINPNIHNLWHLHSK